MSLMDFICIFSSSALLILSVTTRTSPRATWTARVAGVVGLLTVVASRL